LGRDWALCNRTQTAVRPAAPSGFVVGLITGAVAGAGLALWFAPSAAAEIRGRVEGSAKRAGLKARGAHEVERVATAAKSGRGV